MLHCNIVSHWLGACTKWSLPKYWTWHSFVATFSLEILLHEIFPLGAESGTVLWQNLLIRLICHWADFTNMMMFSFWQSSAPAGIILWMRPANERRRYNVTSSVIGRAHSQNDPCPECGLLNLITKILLLKYMSVDRNLHSWLLIGCGGILLIVRWCMVKEKQR